MLLAMQRGIPRPTGELPESVASPWHDLVPPAYLEQMRSTHAATELSRARIQSWSNVKAVFRAVVTFLALVPLMALVVYFTGNVALVATLALVGWLIIAAQILGSAVLRHGKVAALADEALIKAKEVEAEASRNMRTLKPEPEPEISKPPIGELPIVEGASQ